MLLVQGALWGEGWTPAAWHRVRFTPEGKIVRVEGLRPGRTGGALYDGRTLAVLIRPESADAPATTLVLWDAWADQEVRRWAVELVPPRGRGWPSGIVAVPGTTAVVLWSHTTSPRLYVLASP